MKIKELSAEERPRERLAGCGPGALSNGELLAILLRSGTRGESVVDLARRILSLTDGSLVRLSRMSLPQLEGVKGLGKAKAAELLAVFEIGRRFMDEEMNLDKRTIVSPGQIYSMMKPVMKGLATEECWVVYLNSANYVIAKERASQGGLNSTIMDSRVIVSAALGNHAAAIVLVHNHPSGNPRPGGEDLRQTALLKQALSPFNINLVDHIVVCDDCYFSFSDDMVYSG